MAKTPRIHTIRGPVQRRALNSPMRLELLGLFVEQKPLSVAELARRMGRPSSAIHYHVKMLEEAGLLRRTGQRSTGRRPEALFLPVADAFAVEETPGVRSDGTALEVMSAAFRMAERDMKAALADPATRKDGPHRNMLGGRMHCRLSKKELAELNRHLRAIEKMIWRVSRKPEPSPDDSFISLTIALMPLPKREVPS